MKILGDSLFAQNADGTLKSHIATLFLRTPGLVTQKGAHALQRILWTRELSREREEAGQGPLTENEAMNEWASSVDLLITPDFVLIRPDPARMDLALQADEALQTLVSKRQIRFLNTQDERVREALRTRGENWRITRGAQSPEELTHEIEQAHVAIEHARIYYYSAHTGTRYLTVSGLSAVCALDSEACRAQVKEIVHGLNAVNRLGQSEIALFPTTLPRTLTTRFKELDLAQDDAALHAKLDDLLLAWRMEIPSPLRQESTENLFWRNEMSATLAQEPNDTRVHDQDLIQGISPEFFRQIEWLPGGRVEEGELIFDPIYDEARLTQDPELLHLCDPRAHSLLFNIHRLYATIEYVNIGRIARSLARTPVPGARRGSVYIIECKEVNVKEPHIQIARFQKWGIAEHLDEGKDLLTSILLADDYSDYILDRRLACLQLGMNLPHHLGTGRLTEKYLTGNQYRSTPVRAVYYIRAYIPGTASDKIPPARFRNPAFAVAFAYLMGEAAALDVVVGRAATETGENMFDANHEVVQYSPDGLPARVCVTDHAGSFVKYQESLEELAVNYARVVRRRETFVSDYAQFAQTFVTAFERKLTQLQEAYRTHRRAFDELFLHRPYDEAGSCAYRWACILRRLDACAPTSVSTRLKKAIQA